MWTRRKLEGLIAKSLYEELSESERQFLDKHLAACPDLAEERDVLSEVVSAIPSGRPELDRDLLPALRARLEEQTADHGVRVGRWALAGAMCAVLALFLGLAFLNHNPDGAGGDVLTAGPAAVSPLTSVLDKVDGLVANSDFTAAYQTLSEAIAQHPRDEQAGRAQLRLADLAFSNLCWYDKAHAAYEVLVKEYPDALEEGARRAEVADRRDLLAEARLVEYKSLEELELATHSPADAFAELEKVIVRYPNAQFVASRAANKMALLAVSDSAAASDGDSRAMAMVAARDRCTDPVARAQMNLELGLVYSKHVKDFEKARASFLEAAQHPVMAGRAEEALSQMASLTKP